MRTGSKSAVNGVTTYYAGNHYIIPLSDEVKNGTISYIPASNSFNRG